MYPDPNKEQPQYPGGVSPAGRPYQAPVQPTPSPQQAAPQPVQPSQPLQPLSVEPQQPVTPQYSIDYLNQIAPQPKKGGLNNRIFLFIIGGGLLVALIIGIMTLASSSNGPTQTMQTLAARMLTLQTISDTAQKNIKSTKLRNTNSSLAIFLTSANHAIVAPLKTSGVDIKKIDKKITTTEKNTALVAKLEDARLNATFDRTYAREMSYQLSTVEALMKTIYNKTKSKSMKDFLSQTNGNIAPIITQLDDFNTTTAND
jgi:hypothetical protein